MGNSRAIILSPQYCYLSSLQVSPFLFDPRAKTGADSQDKTRAKKSLLNCIPGLHPADVGHVRGVEQSGEARDPQAAAQGGQAARGAPRPEGGRLQDGGRVHAALWNSGW